MVDGTLRPEDDHHKRLHYCPGHTSVEENEDVDALVKNAARDEEAFRADARRGASRSYAYASSAATARALGEWESSAEPDPRGYWGRYHLKGSRFRALRHTGKYPLKMVGGRPTLVARFVRCITNHAPTGQYRDRFRRRMQEPTRCAFHGDSPEFIYHTREHVLFRCAHYTRKYRHSSIEELLAARDPFYEIRDFLVGNPTALSFDDVP